MHRRGRLLVEHSRAEQSADGVRQQRPVGTDAKGRRTPRRQFYRTLGSVTLGRTHKKIGPSVESPEDGEREEREKPNAKPSGEGHFQDVEKARKMARDEVEEDWRRRKAPPPPPPRRNDNLLTGWSATLVALFIGAAVVGNIISLRRRLANFHRFSEGNSATSGAGRANSSYQETRKFYHVDEAEARRIWAAHMQEMERLRRRQEVFDRERMRYKQNYDSWQERHGDHWDWRWHGNRWEWQGESERNWYEESADNWRRQNQRTRTKAEPSRAVDNYQHYVALGLNPAQSRSYTEADIKAAFRKKAKEYHPDTNRDKVDAEKKFHQVMEAYNSLRESKAT